MRRSHCRRDQIILGILRDQQRHPDVRNRRAITPRQPGPRLDPPDVDRLQPAIEHRNAQDHAQLRLHVERDAIIIRQPRDDALRLPIAKARQRRSITHRPAAPDIGGEEALQRAVRCRSQILRQIGRRRCCRSPHQGQVGRISARCLRGPQCGMSALRFAPHCIATAGRRARDRPRRAHPVDHRSRRILADQERMHPRASKPRIIGRDHDIAVPDRPKPGGDAPEILAQRRCAAARDAPRPVGPRQHWSRLGRYRLTRRDHHPGHLARSPGGIGGPISHPPRLHSSWRIDDRIGGDQRARLLGDGGRGDGQ